jgi:hypothetical protein
MNQASNPPTDIEDSDSDSKEKGSRD